MPTLRCRNAVAQPQKPSSPGLPFRLLIENMETLPALPPFVNFYWPAVIRGRIRASDVVSVCRTPVCPWPMARDTFTRRPSSRVRANPASCLTAARSNHFPDLRLVQQQFSRGFGFVILHVAVGILINARCRKNLVLLTRANASVIWHRPHGSPSPLCRAEQCRPRRYQEYDNRGGLWSCERCRPPKQQQPEVEAPLAARNQDCLRFVFLRFWRWARASTSISGLSQPIFSSMISRRAMSAAPRLV